VTLGRWLAVCALVYGTLHHQGTLLDGLGQAVDHTGWADWIDLATPYAVLLPVAAALLALTADRVAWGLYLLGAITYVEGHGIHLSANSIGNAEPAGATWPPIVHLWDEVVGHHLWITGVVLVVLALARAARGLALPPPWAAYPLSALVGVTFFTNAVEGGAAALGLVGATALAAAGWTDRRGYGRQVLVAFGGALALLTAYGVWQGGFPQFTELGWV
jgi:hypothetical protein